LLLVLSIYRRGLRWPMHRRLQVVTRGTKQDEVCGTRYDESGDRAEGPLKLPRREQTSARRAVNRNGFNRDFRTSRLGEQKTVHPILEPFFRASPLCFRERNPRHREIL
jgi:hypothetical protein